MPAWAPFASDDRRCRISEDASNGTKKRGDDGPGGPQVLSGDAPAFNPISGHVAGANSPRSAVRDPQLDSVGLLGSPGRGNLATFASPRPRGPVPTARPLDAFSSDTLHSASWIWPLRSNDLVEAPAGDQGSGGDGSTAAASGSTQSSPTRIGGAPVDLADGASGPVDTNTKTPTPMATRYVFVQNLHPRLSEEEFGFRFQVR